MRRLTTAVAVAAAGLGWAAPAPKGPPKVTPPGIAGRWAVESIVVNGTPGSGTAAVVTYTADGTFETRDRSGAVIASGTYALDPAQDPAGIDLTLAGSGETWLGIYQLDGDTRTTCTLVDRRKRPTTFESAPGSGVIRTVFKRVKPKD